MVHSKYHKAPIIDIVRLTQIFHISVGIVPIAFAVGRYEIFGLSLISQDLQPTHAANQGAGSARCRYHEVQEWV